MGQKDITEKILADFNDVFADIINVLLFHGSRPVIPEDLYNISVHSQYKADNGIMHELERDVVKYWVPHQIRFAILGVEHQTQPERYMPLRMIGYDGAAYRSQLPDDGVQPAPVITIVLHFGTEKRWDEPLTLKELVDIPKGLEEYVNDYKITVFDIAWLTDEQLSMFQSDFGIVANFFVQKRKKSDYVPDDKRVIRHVDQVLKLLSVMSGDDRYEKILQKGETVKNMCDVAERLEQKGIQKGIQQGIQQGISQGKLEKSISVFKNMIKRDYSIEDAQAISELTDAQVADIMRSLEK